MAFSYSDISDRAAGSPLGGHLGWESVGGGKDTAILRMPFAEHNVTVGNMVHGGALN